VSSKIIKKEDVGLATHSIFIGDHHHIWNSASQLFYALLIIGFANRTKRLSILPYAALL